MTILIPAYEPNWRLIRLISELKAICDFNIVIVDDGSGSAYSNIFKRAREMGCTVLTHEFNKGKGQALKTGFRYIKHLPDKCGVVCSDCDGQHLPEDIIKIAESINKHKNSIILGTRKFIGKVPFRSRLGNGITRAVFSFISGKKVYDTQTGLRGYSYDMLEWLCSISGNRFEYEMNILIEAASAGYSFYELDISTVYLEQNKSSHFHPLRDSLKVYLPVLKFSMASLLSGALDFVLLATIQFFTRNLLYSVIGARIISASFNYTINKLYVFSRSAKSSVKESLPRYLITAVFIMMANYGIIHTYNIVIGIPLMLSKIFTETTLFFLSFWIQRKYVFNRGILGHL